jgi:hypothetical protein
MEARWQREPPAGRGSVLLALAMCGEYSTGGR